MKLDLLIMAAHPDDAELGCAGTILANVQAGRKVGIVDFTRGELGTRGTPETRHQEAKNASAILGISARENLGLPDGFFRNDPESQLKLISVIRKYQPDVVIANAPTDRHIDHGRGALLASDACFLSGLRRIETQEDGEMQSAWRPRAVYHYIQDRYMTPDLIVDITPFWEQKIRAIRAFATQFHNPDLNEPQTVLSTPDFLNFVEARARELGRTIGVTFAEGFTTQRTPGVKDLFDLL